MSEATIPNLSPVEKVVLADLECIVRFYRDGCGNHGCRVKKPTGQATNGPCLCKPRLIARALRDAAKLLEGEK
jgi:hypothetical protein